MEPDGTTGWTRRERVTAMTKRTVATLVGVLVGGFVLANTAKAGDVSFGFYYGDRDYYAPEYAPVYSSVVYGGCAPVYYDPVVVVRPASRVVVYDRYPVYHRTYVSRHHHVYSRPVYYHRGRTVRVYR